MYGQDPNETIYITQDPGIYAISSKQPVTHLITLDYGDLEVRLYHKAMIGSHEDEIINGALAKAFARGLELPREEMVSFECYPIPEYDEE